MTRVLVVEDEESFSDALSYMLRKEGFEVAVCPTGPDALDTFDRSGADLVLLDLMLPGLPGSEVCRNLRERSNVPVIMLTAKDSEIDKVVGLELGADDYVTKPFSSRELVARMRAVLRRRGDADEPAASILESGPVRMDVDRHVVTVHGGQVQLPLKEFELLEVLLRNSGRVLTRMQLIDRVWGADYVGDTKTLDVHVKRLRAKVETDPASPSHIVTVRGPGLQVRARRLTSGRPVTSGSAGAGEGVDEAPAPGLWCLCLWCPGVAVTVGVGVGVGVGAGENVAKGTEAGITGTLSLTTPAFWKVSTVSKNVPPGTALVRSRSSTLGSGPVSSTVVCGGRVTALSLGSWTVDVAEGTWMLVSLSVRLVLLDRARNIPASLPAGSCCGRSRAEDEHVPDRDAVPLCARTIGGLVPLLGRRVVAGLAAGQHSSQRHGRNGEQTARNRRGPAAGLRRITACAPHGNFTGLTTPDSVVAAAARQVGRPGRCVSRRALRLGGERREAGCELPCGGPGPAREVCT